MNTGVAITVVMPWLNVTEDILIRWGYNGDRAGRWGLAYMSLSLAQW